VGEEQPDAELLVLIRSSDRGAWKVLTHRHSHRLWAIARHQGLSSDLAADVVQTVWLTLLDSVDQIRDPSALRWWLNQVARRESIRVSRRQRRFELESEVAPPAHPAENADLVSFVIRRERAAEIRSALARISDRCQELLRVLFSDARLSYVDISEILDMPVGAIGPTRQRCLDQLRRLVSSP
jgi:RNA polymerase sigma factor (sigma-70 family)